MHVVAIGDLHLGLVYKGIPYTDRILKCVMRIEEQLVQEESEIAFAVFLGDIFHSAPSALTFLYALRLFKCWDDRAFQTYVLMGNHDVKIEALFALFLEYDFKNVHFVIGPSVVEIDEPRAKYTAAFIPSMPPSMPSPEEHLREWFEKAFNKAEGPILVFSHHDLSSEAYNYKAGSEDEMFRGKRQFLPQEIIDDERVRLVVNGHLHHPQTLDKIELPGSLETLRFGEGNERCYIKVEL